MKWVMKVCIAYIPVHSCRNSKQDQHGFWEENIITCLCIDLNMVLNVAGSFSWTNRRTQINSASFFWEGILSHTQVRFGRWRVNLRCCHNGYTIVFWLQCCIHVHTIKQVQNWRSYSTCSCTANTHHGVNLVPRPHPCGLESRGVGHGDKTTTECEANKMATSKHYVGVIRYTHSWRPRRW